jgi:hypothetical protein
MTELSPAAQAVLAAMITAGFGPLGRGAAAAALRAAAHNVDWESGDPKFMVLAIAAELEGSND